MKRIIKTLKAIDYLLISRAIQDAFLGFTLGFLGGSISMWCSILLTDIIFLRAILCIGSIFLMLRILDIFQYLTNKIREK